MAAARVLAVRADGLHVAPPASQCFMKTDSCCAGRCEAPPPAAATLAATIAAKTLAGNPSCWSGGYTAARCCVGMPPYKGGERLVIATTKVVRSR
jgi:hypothetical protein